MQIKSSYKPRYISFLEIHEITDWKVKIYSISTNKATINPSKLKLAKQKLASWLFNCKTSEFKSHEHATLILHQGETDFFAVLTYWLDENMIQICSYKLEGDAFKLISENGCITCVWELAVIWHERNAWVKHILMQPNEPNFNAYLDARLNQSV